MSLTRTTLAAAVAATDEQITVAAVTGATVGGIVKIDNEFAIVKAIASPVVELSFRGKFGTVAAAHANGQGVVFGLATDMLALGVGQTGALRVAAKDSVGYNADGAIAVPVRDTKAHLTKGSAAAMTLAAPSTLADDVELEIVSDSAYAHTVTFTPGFYGDTTSSDVATFAAKAGASMTVVASGGRWGIKALANVSLA